MAETDMIRTHDQRLRVFVSSTLQELAAERQAVRDAVTSLRLVRRSGAGGTRTHGRRIMRSRPARQQSPGRRPTWANHQGRDHARRYFGTYPA
jgi:hypothetical protein